MYTLPDTVIIKLVTGVDITLFFNFEYFYAIVLRILLQCDILFYVIEVFLLKNCIVVSFM